MVFGARCLSALECFMRWSYASGSVGTLSFSAHLVWFIILFPVLALWQSFHFNVVHLILHQPNIYKYVHAVHHRNVNTDPWSGMSMHPLEAFSYARKAMAANKTFRNAARSVGLKNSAEKIAVPELTVAVL